MAEQIGQGAGNLDIGCFQLNYRWHGAAFASLADMFDPDRNATYAADYLASHYQRTGIGSPPPVPIIPQPKPMRRGIWQGFPTCLIPCRPSVWRLCCRRIRAVLCGRTAIPCWRGQGAGDRWCRAAPAGLRCSGAPAMMQRFLPRPTVLLASGLMAVIAMMILPVPTWLLDIGLAASFALAILMFTVTLFVDRPLEFSAFPTILLASLLLRLALNVSSTKLIIGEGHTGTDAAGHVIEGFANFIMGGNLLLGIVVFCVLLIVNFMVITKGAYRMAEVGARFALDGCRGGSWRLMPIWRQVPSPMPRPRPGARWNLRKPTSLDRWMAHRNS